MRSNDAIEVQPYNPQNSNINLMKSLGSQSERALGTSEQGLREVVEQAATVLGVPLDNLQLGRRGAAKTQQRPQQLPEQLAPQMQLVGDSKEALEDPEEPVACDACSKVFSAQSYLDKHIMAKHGEQNLLIKREGGVRPFSCDLCKREFKQASHLLLRKGANYQVRIFSGRLYVQGFQFKFEKSCSVPTPPSYIADF